MRFHRLKKQIEGPSAVKKPRKPRVEKNKSPKKPKERKQSTEDGHQRVKTEVGEAGAGVGNFSAESTPEAGSQESQHANPVVKREPGLTAGYPLTPVGSQTPSPRYDGNMSEIDEMALSFTMPQSMPSSIPGGMAGEPDMYPEVMNGGHAYGMGISMGIQDPYNNMWHHQPQSHAYAHSHTQNHGSGVGSVKTEPR